MAKTKKSPLKTQPKKNQSRGIIVSDKMDQTAVVKIMVFKQDKLYKKRYRLFKRYLVHNPNNKFKAGETVIIEKCRPLSKKKRWRIIKKV